MIVVALLSVERLMVDAAVPVPMTTTSDDVPVVLTAPLDVAPEEPEEPEEAWEPDDPDAVFVPELAAAEVCDAEVAPPATKAEVLDSA